MNGKALIERFEQAEVFYGDTSSGRGDEIGKYAGGICIGTSCDDNAGHSILQGGKAGSIARLVLLKGHDLAAFDLGKRLVNVRFGPS